MITSSRSWIVPVVMLGVMIFAYFVTFPQDIAVVQNVLALSAAVSPWLYGVIAVTILCYTAMRIWGGNSKFREVASHNEPSS